MRTDPPGKAAELQEKGARQAEALAHFMTGLFTEESAGPEKALESKRKVLDLDPACSELAIEVAYEYLRQGEIAEAVSVLKDTIAAAPKVTAPYLALSMIYLRHLQKPDLAARYVTKALETAPQNIAAYEMLWEIYQTQGQMTKAAGVLDKAASVKSDDPEYWLSLAEVLGRSQLKNGSTFSPEAQARIVKYVDQAVALGPTKPENLSRAGDLYVLSRQIPQAIPLYKQVLEIKPGFPRIREKLAACYIETGEVQPAIEQVEELVKANPLSLPAYQQLTALYIKQGDYSKALGNARQALLIEPTNLDRHSVVIDLLYRLERYSEMADALAETRKQFPQVANLTHLQAVALSQAKRSEEAMKVFAEAEVEAMNTQPDLLTADFYFQYGASAEQSKQYAKAAELFKRSIEMDPANSARACNYLGYMWVEQDQNLDEAEQLIRRAIALEQGNGAYHDSLGWLFYKKGQYQDALAELLRAAEFLKEEPDAVVYDHIGDAYDQMGKKAEAVLYWQKALQLDPENKDIVGKVDKNAEKVVQSPDKATPSRK